MNDQMLRMLLQLSCVSGVDPNALSRLGASLSDCILSVDYGLQSKEQFEKPTELISPRITSSPASRLVKYYSNRRNAEGLNYSMASLLDGTVHLSSPRQFNDPFDCLPSFDRKRAYIAIAQRFIDTFDLKIKAEAEAEVDVDNAIANALNSKTPEDLPHLPHVGDASPAFEPLLTYQRMYLNSYRKGNFSADAVHDALASEVDSTGALLRNCRVACFTDNPVNMYMWAHYAADHTGFCVEYDLPTVQLDEFGKSGDWDAWLLSNIYGVFYHMRRPDCTNLLLSIPSQECDIEGVSSSIAKLLCSKGFDWAFERERKLIVFDRTIPDNVRFFPIKRVYLGARMPNNDKEEIAEALKGRKVKILSMDLSDSLYSLVANKYEPGK